ncbi:GNAT family N-acetyltransferase [Sphingobium nicotianae]|uniref:GNAT family N-acetyltransferase n=1 Tax=Sphingobium nicotianae TaxID=2782607 RepID=A0A9X1IQX7_9SPHN|nr:GNAT family N-acetyltransferase [Sphingobium nicotianae]MBT2186929.1 GNAT family N-acetyltransferase [Sphingobium nicotianae]
MATEIQLRCYNSFAQLRADAAGRLDGGAQPGPFDRLDWFEALHARAFEGEYPLVLQASRGDAYAWLFLTGPTGGPLRGIANWYSFVFRPQFASAADGATRLALLTAIARDLRGRSVQLRFHPIIDDTPADDALLTNAFEAAGWRVISRVMARKRLLHLPPDACFEDYWGQRPGALRSTFKRKAHRHPLDIAIHGSIDDQSWAALEALFGASWKPEGDDFAFLRTFAESEAVAGRLRLGLGRLDGQPAAVELWTIEQGRAYIHKLAFDERFAHASPGTQLSHAMFRNAIDVDKVRLIDFGTGDNDYKANWMPAAVPMRQVDAFDLRHPASWRPAFAAWLSALSQPGGEGTHIESKASGGRRAALDLAVRGKA